MNVSELQQWFYDMARKVMPSVFYRGVYEFRVESASDGRLSLVPADPKDELDVIALCEVWPGIGGYKITPAAGTVVLVSFVKGELTKPRCVGFIPLSYTAPTESVIDATAIKLGAANYKQAARKEDNCGYLLWDPSVLTLYYAPGATLPFVAVAINPQTPNPPSGLGATGTPIAISTGSNKVSIQ